MSKEVSEQCKSILEELPDGLFYLYVTEKVIKFQNLSMLMDLACADGDELFFFL